MGLTIEGHVGCDSHDYFDGIIYPGEIETLRSEQIF